MSAISAVIIAKNESANIGRCIDSLSGIVDEVILVDSGSQDDTVIIARSKGAKILEPGWQGYGQNKNLGNEAASNDWILSIDADEWLSDPLKSEIQELELHSGIVYRINRKNLYNGSIVRHSGWSPDWVDRLFHKSHATWNDRLVHEKLIYNPAKLQIRKLKCALMHESYSSIEDHKKKTSKYAKLKAKSWIDDGKTPSFSKRYFGPGFKAFQSYILRLGFLDGSNGVTIAKMNAFLIRQQIFFFDLMKSETQ